MNGVKTGTEAKGKIEICEKVVVKSIADLLLIFGGPIFLVDAT